MLTLPITREWFDLIEIGYKKEEYREIKLYYVLSIKKKRILNEAAEDLPVKKNFSAIKSLFTIF